MSEESDEKPSASIVPLRRQRPCPSCGKPSSRADYPFCSRRCADVDLNRWFSGSYAIPVVQNDGGDDGLED